MENQNENNSPHILNTSANLLGLCFIVLTSIKVLKLKEVSIIDELTTVAILFFMISSILSFLAMRHKSLRNNRYEKIADYIFLAGLFFLFFTTMLIAFNIIS
ncbi:hypothetical protein AHMF7605_24935 [Adhaeribacter arboris]|uniref:Uncharacterized protein n=1 Tax=Adhaeribacter arboris TaxID=2072846 RepID=A0A2T2YLX1_9BACT|nr:hypothetical protein [Adhaeribacter arboris]PSR56508.1 hypothetical protein AHMF7605_24935 [Adhaeribacter arboris]